jgi:NAD(P)-dependent dehydrogenase (short-subunit alcohol dehydrogenase family)
MVGKTIILTGASKGTVQPHGRAVCIPSAETCGSGIGLAIAKFLLRSPNSCNLVVLARSQGPLEELKSQYPKQVEVITGDLAKFGLGQKAVETAHAAFGNLDGMILNHGRLSPVERVGSTDVEDWRDAFDLNFFSIVDFVKYMIVHTNSSVNNIQVKQALPALRKSKGRILFTSSGAATTAYSTWGSYGASKAAINHLAMTLGVEEPDVTTISIRPGMVDTAMQQELRDSHLQNMDPNDAKKFRSAHEDGKLLKPEQPGHVIGKLVLEAPKEFSGKFLA